MRNSSFEDVERVKNGEFVPNVMFGIRATDLLVHMKPLFSDGNGNGFYLGCGKAVYETDFGDILIVHSDNLRPIKKHAFSSNASKKIKRKHVKGSRKYVKVPYNLGRAIDVCKKQGYITLVYGGVKLKRFADVIDGVWRYEDGSWERPFHTSSNVYEYMYVPVEISPKHQASISTDLSKSVNQFAEDAKLGEVMRKAGWRINDGQIPCHNSQHVKVILRNGVVPRAACIAEDWPWNYTETGSDIIAYKIIE